MGVRGRTRELTRELTSSPFFPLLFIGEAVKNTTFHLVADQPPTDVVLAAVVMAALSVAGWLYSYEEVAWGLQKAAETVEESTDG